MGASRTRGAHCWTWLRVKCRCPSQFKSLHGRHVRTVQAGRLWTTWPAGTAGLVAIGVKLSASRAADKSTQRRVSRSQVARHSMSEGPVRSLDALTVWVEAVWSLSVNVCRRCVRSDVLRCVSSRLCDPDLRKAGRSGCAGILEAGPSTWQGDAGATPPDAAASHFEAAETRRGRLKLAGGTELKENVRAADGMDQADRACMHKSSWIACMTYSATAT